MAQNGKVMDGVHPGDTPPAPTSRPVIVSNRSFMKADPMLAPATPKSGVSDKSTATITTAPLVSRQAKDVVPKTAQTPTRTEHDEVSSMYGHSEDETTPDTSVTADETKNDTVVEPGEAESDETLINAEIERQIDAGTYFVSVGQVKRRRRAVIFATVIIVLLVFVLVDLLLDAGIVKISGVPHTRLFMN